MAFRGEAHQINTSVASSCVINVASIGIQNGDVVLINVIEGGGGSAVFSSTGFATVANTAIASGGVNSQAFSKVAGASEPSTYTVLSTVSDLMAATVRVYSGRSGAITTSLLFNGFVSTGPSPLTLPSTTIVPAAGDDLAFLGTIEDSGDLGTMTYTPGAGFANGTLGISVGSSFTNGVYGSDEVNVASGSASFAAGQLTSTGGSITAFGCFISLAVGSVPANTASIAWVT